MSKEDREPVDHYMRGGLECIDVMRAISTPEGFQEHCRLTAFKYLYRLGEKDCSLKEAKKALDYARWLYESLEAEERKRQAAADIVLPAPVYRESEPVPLPDPVRSFPNAIAGRCPHGKIVGTWCEECDGGWARREVSKL